ncbi:MAG: hypothetical protein KBT03_11050 [Bacteroidales bacterium]|nr:hypothetical protein [Candidatus Scybalousia scybalohippi]
MYKSRYTGEQIDEAIKKAIEGGGGSGGGMISTTYSELKVLRDSGTLLEGTLYRITDYTCTTEQEYTSSAGHVFDIIALALSKNELGEECRACKHDGDTYFNNSTLAAWKIWYSIDNDKSRFRWANESGNGVVYRMIDEYNNDCPYDFKNIKFARFKVTGVTEGLDPEPFTSTEDFDSLIGAYLGNTPYPQMPIEIDINDYIWAYTFSDYYDNECEDASLTGSCFNNRIHDDIRNESPMSLPNITFLDGSRHNVVVKSTNLTLYYESERCALSNCSELMGYMTITSANNCSSSYLIDVGGTLSRVHKMMSASIQWNLSATGSENIYIYTKSNNCTIKQSENITITAYDKEEETIYGCNILPCTVFDEMTTIEVKNDCYIGCVESQNEE